MTQQKGVSLFYFHAPQDEALCNSLDEHLTSFKHRHSVGHPWREGKIPPGENTQDTIENYLRTAQVILLLVNAHFINTYDKQIRIAIQRHHKNEKNADIGAFESSG